VVSRIDAGDTYPRWPGTAAHISPQGSAVPGADASGPLAVAVIAAADSAVFVAALAAAVGFSAAAAPGAAGSAVAVAAVRI
jgi:hypothetical protein